MDISEYGRVVKTVLTIGLLLFGGLGGVLIITWFSRKLRVVADKEHSLKLVNQGNCCSQYYLSIKKAPSNLNFTFLINNIPLAPVFEESEEEVLENEEEYIETTTSNTPTHTEAKKSKDKSKAAAAKPEGALKAGKAAGAKTGVLANLLGTLGSILPGSLGKSLQKQAGVARDVQSKTAKATQAPQSAQRKMDSLKQSGGKLGVKASKSEQNSRPTSRRGTGAEKKFDKNERDVVSNPPANNSVVIKRKVAVEKTGFVQTKDMEPGESLFLTLRIGTQEKRYPAGSFGYTLESQTMPLNRKLGETSPTIKNGLVHFEPIAFWRYWLPTLSRIFVILLILLGFFYGLTFIWM